MYPYTDKEFNYTNALEIQYPEIASVAKQHNVKQSKKIKFFVFFLYHCTYFFIFLATINMTFDKVEDAAGFTDAVFTTSKENVYMLEPNFLNPRKQDELFHDYSTNCVIM